MSLDQRRVYEKDRFNELKQIKSQGTDVAVYYAINGIWIEKWKSFVKHKNQPLPGEITNLNMKSFIIQKRKER
jgi:hypothetical protein